MDIKDALIRQYAASVKTISNAAQACPKSLWSSATPKYRFWQVAYHALFFTHLYASASIDEFTPWANHREGLESMDPIQEEGESFCTVEDVIRYAEHAMQLIRDGLPEQDLSGPSGIPWWNEFSKFEMHIYNIRHVQHHAGQLVDRLRNEAGVESDWVGTA